MGFFSLHHSNAPPLHSEVADATSDESVEFGFGSLSL